MDICSICEQGISQTNTAIFECGHTFHLSCVMQHATLYHTTCPECQVNSTRLPDLGTDRQVAQDADIQTRIQQRQLKPTVEHSTFEKFARVISPLTPRVVSFLEHMRHNKKLSVIRQAGFCPRDAVQEGIRWPDIATRYKSTDILEFGFAWDHMVSMGIRPSDVQNFTWSQQKHKLELDAAKLMKIRMTITELASLQYSTHQLIELGFDWPTMARMGANVGTWPLFKIELADIKRYWSPTISQWVAAGFYDKDRLARSGWPMDDVLEVLPAMTQRSAGRTLRLAF